MKVDLKRYRIPPKTKVDLSQYPTLIESEYSKKTLKKEVIKPNMEELRELQAKLYAENRQALLLCLQAMDAAGKDGVIKHVMSGVNPQGCHVVSFKQPSAIELDHDYLWRIHKNVPARGEIGIFNRSHYEEVIVTRVHELPAKQQLPLHLVTDNIWSERFEQINNFEKYLYRNGICTVKIFLHLSPEEQKKRLLDRIDRPEKNWKFSASDLEERKHWKHYTKAYEELLSHTSTEHSPWYVVPADDKWFGRYIISEILLHHLRQMDPKYPKLRKEQEDRLQEFRSILEEQ